MRFFLLGSILLFSCYPVSFNFDDFLCGNGFVDEGEECDDGNKANGDTCNEFCLVEIPEGCGNGEPDFGEECDDGNNLPGDGCRADCQGEEICGDGLLDSRGQAREACDDGNTVSGDGCSALCQLEADEFVRCTDSTTNDGNGSFLKPFNSLSDAIKDSDTKNGEVLMILEGTCNAAGVIRKSLTIQGVRLDNEIRSFISAGDQTAIEIKSPINVAPVEPFEPSEPVNLTPEQLSDNNQIAPGTGAPVELLIRDLVISSSSSKGSVFVNAGNNAARIALLGVEISNGNDDDAANNAVGVRCNTAANAKVLIDRAVLLNSNKGALQIEKNCRVVVSNSLFLQNGSLDGNGAITIDGANAILEVFFSVFSGNRGASGSALSCTSSSIGRIFGSILEINSQDIPFSDTCDVRFSSIQGVPLPPGEGNTSDDPDFVKTGDPIDPAFFRLGENSLVRDRLEENFSITAFNVESILGDDVLSHDFKGNNRPDSAGTALDMGIFEEGAP